MVKHQQMHWTKRGAHLLLQVPTQVMNGDLRGTFRRWYPGMKAGSEDPIRRAARSRVCRCPEAQRNPSPPVFLVIPHEGREDSEQVTQVATREGMTTPDPNHAVANLTCALSAEQPGISPCGPLPDRVDSTSCRVLPREIESGHRWCRAPAGSGLVLLQARHS